MQNVMVNIFLSWPDSGDNCSQSSVSSKTLWCFISYCILEERTIVENVWLLRFLVHYPYSAVLNKMLQYNLISPWSDSNNISDKTGGAGSQRPWQDNKDKEDSGHQWWGSVVKLSGVSDDVRESGGLTRCISNSYFSHISSSHLSLTRGMVSRRYHTKANFGLHSINDLLMILIRTPTFKWSKRSR